MRLTERDMEDLIVLSPKRYINEDGLKLVARQYRIGKYIFDLLFEDRYKSKLLVEIQKGTLDRNHTYKIQDYRDEYKQNNPTEFIDVMIIANNIPSERKERLSSWGITFIEITESRFLSDPLFVDRNTLLSADQTDIPVIDQSRNIIPNLVEQSNIDSIGGRRNFENIIEWKKWKDESIGDLNMTVGRIKQLTEIFKAYKSFSIPFSHYSQDKMRNSSRRNYEIYPIINAFHKGFFTIENDSIVLKPKYFSLFNIS
ncbi:MAG: hypothetical protein C0397_05745 [Odoribacter sp.]|nr:hypothetical protein [Odoribacter sp.]